MKRAALLIGVKKTGGLPALNAAHDGARKMYEWARTAGFQATLLTDETTPVTVARIYEAIEQILKESVQQLLIYFGGHGVNLQFSEYWLLSGAPTNGNEAVNVAESEALARRCNVPHVIMVSDACRTAAEGIQAQSVRGGSIFPNAEPMTAEQSVDLFFATLLGSPSLEIKDKNESSGRYCAVYTEELRDALRGKYPEYLVPDATDGSQVLRPRRLKKLLATRVPARVATMLKNPYSATQSPDARITSDDDAWLARFPARPTRSPTKLEELIWLGDDATGSTDATSIEIEEPPAVPTLRTEAYNAVSQAISGNALAALDRLANAPVEGSNAMVDQVRRETAPFGRQGFESRCGFKVRGANVVFAESPTVTVEIDNEDLAVRVWIGDARSANVLLELSDGRVVILPAIASFVSTLWFEQGELRNVLYEPSFGTDRYADYQHQREELASLRSLIAASIRLSGFQLEREDAPQLTERIRMAKEFDPAMSLYAAYSYHALGNRALIRKMQSYLQANYGFTLFDVEMLSGEHLTSEKLRPDVLGLVPFLAQGWALLDAFKVRLPGAAQRLRHYIGPSLWTIFDAAALPLLRDLLRNRQ